MRRLVERQKSRPVRHHRRRHYGDGLIWSAQLAWSDRPLDGPVGASYPFPPQVIRSVASQKATQRIRQSLDLRRSHARSERDNSRFEYKKSGKLSRSK